MERSTVIGRVKNAGFTLLELMIVISVIIILAAITLPQYQKTIMHTREAVMRDDLRKMRSLIDQFAADKGRLPQSLDELVSEGYIREVPVDPMTNQKDWAVTMGDDPSSSEGGQGVNELAASAGLLKQKRWSLTLPEATSRTLVVTVEGQPQSGSELQDILTWK